MDLFKRYHLPVLVSLVTGGVLGCFKISWLSVLSSTIMELFLNLLQLISLPMLALAILSTITQLPWGRWYVVLSRILKYTFLTTIIASSVGCLLFIAIRPTSPHHAPSEGEPASTQSLVLSHGHTYHHYLSLLKKIIPNNLCAPFLENNVLASLFISSMFGLAILSLPAKKREIISQFVQGLFEAQLKIASFVMRMMPIAIFAFTLHFVEHIRSHREQIEQLGLYSLCIIGANLIQGVVVLPLLLKCKKISPLRAAKSMTPALIMAFFSKSSSATLPLTLECAQNRLNLSEKVTKLSFPLCSIINMNGCAAFILITVFFISTGQGIPLTLGQVLLWIVFSTLAAIGNAGVPMGCFFLTSVLLTSMQLPLTTLGYILPLYSLFDMLETSLNVWSDSCVTLAVAKDLQKSPPVGVVI